MSTTKRSECLAHRDARLYCQRRHQKTMGKCAREERQRDALLARQLRHIQKSKTYREKELDREQEKCLTDLVAIFDRQCQIATTRLARRLKDALGDKEIVEGLWGKKNDDAQQRLGKAKGEGVKQAGTHHSPLNGNDMNSFCSPSRGLTSQKQRKIGYKLSSNNIITPVNGLSKDNRIMRPDSPMPWQRKRATELQQLPNLNQQQLFRNQLSIRESVQLQATNGGVAKRPISRQQTATRPKTAPEIGETRWSSNNRWDELASHVRCPQHCKDAPAHMSTARSLRCLMHDVKESKTATPMLDAPEDVCFRRQYMACVMSRKLPVSGLRSGNFAQQDDVRKKMESRKKCMEEMRMTNRQRVKSAPAGLVRMYKNDLSAN